MKLQAGH